MSQLFNRREVSIITNDLKTFLSAVKGPIDKLDYFTSKANDLETTGCIEMEYRYELIDIIPEVENAVIQQLDLAEKMQVSIQLHLSPASLMIRADRLFFQQAFFRLLSTLLEANEKKSVVSVYVTDSDGKCIIEVINRSGTVKEKDADNYFKKYRITNALPAQTAQHDAVLTIYKQLMTDMGGELGYSFTKDKPNHFRLKFTLA